MVQYQKRQLWGSTGLSFTLRRLFSCFFGKLALPSNRVNVKPACPKLGILYRPAAACSISLERLAPVVLLLLLLLLIPIAAAVRWCLQQEPVDQPVAKPMAPVYLPQNYPVLEMSQNPAQMAPMPPYGM